MRYCSPAPALIGSRERRSDQSCGHLSAVEDGVGDDVAGQQHDGIHEGVLPTIREGGSHEAPGGAHALGWCLKAIAGVVGVPPQLDHLGHGGNVTGVFAGTACGPAFALSL